MNKDIICEPFQNNVERSRFDQRPPQDCGDLESVKLDPAIPVDKSSSGPAGEAYGGRPVDQDTVRVCSRHKHVHLCDWLSVCLNKE